jgi:hypothetical protein
MRGSCNVASARTVRCKYARTFEFPGNSRGRKVVLRKTANRECIACDAGFRPQRTSLCVRSESRIGNSRDISEGWQRVEICAKYLIYNDKTVAELQ